MFVHIPPPQLYNAKCFSSYTTRLPGLFPVFWYNAGDMADEVIVIGGGLAGCEAAWHIAERGLRVRLYEMRPVVMTPAHRSEKLAELVCSSSLKSNSPATAHGLLKEEMRRLGSIVLDCALRAAVPGGDALCVDREAFAGLVTQAIETHPPHRSGAGRSYELRNAKFECSASSRQGRSRRPHWPRASAR